jgi:hypothetical protein
MIAEFAQKKLSYTGEGKIKNEIATIAKYWWWMPRGNCGAG